MRELTHEQARRLIHAAADRALSTSDRRRLEAHLAACDECRAFQAEIEHLQHAVVRALRERWSRPQSARSKYGKISAQTLGAVRRNRFFRAANRFSQVASLFVIALLLARWVQVWESPAVTATLEAPAPVRSVRAAPIEVRQAAIPAVEFEADDAPANTMSPVKVAQHVSYDPPDTWVMGDRLLAR